MEESEIKNKLSEGDIICYRVNLVRVITVEDDGCWIEGPYGEQQKIDWEDVDRYNPNLATRNPAKTISAYIRYLFGH